MNQGQFRKHIFLNCVGPTVRDSGGIWKNNFWILVSLLLLLLKISFCFPSFNCCEISASSLLYGEFSSFNFQPFCPSTSVILVIFLLSWDNWMYVFSFQEGKKKKKTELTLLLNAPKDYVFMFNGCRFSVRGRVQ